MNRTTVNTRKWSTCDPTCDYCSAEPGSVDASDADGCTCDPATCESAEAVTDDGCPAEYVTGGHDPCGTSCDLPRGHDGAHQGSDPFDGDSTIEWRGGGTVAGDPVPYRDVRNAARQIADTRHADSNWAWQVAREAGN